MCIYTGEDKALHRSEDFFQIHSGIACRILRHLLRRAPGDDCTAAASALGTHVHDVVRGLYHVEVVFNDKHCISALGKLLEYFNQLAHVRRVKSRGRLIKNIDSLSGGALGKFRSQLDALCFTAG